MDVLVTGGAGFIGSTLVERLLAEGHRIEVVDDLSTGSLANLAAAREQARREGTGALRIHQADVHDDGLDALLGRHAPEVVVHLAGATAKAGRRAPAQVVHDVAGTVRVLDAAVAAGVRKVVCVAGARSQADVVRGIPARAVHEYLDAYQERHGLAHTTVVLPTVYGPRQTTATESSVVAVFVQRALAGEPCVIHGDGSQSRDLLYVDDAVDALVRSLDRADGATVEIGTGAATTIADLQATVARITAVDCPQVPGERRPHEPGEVVADPRRARSLLGWEPWTPLEEGLALTVAAART
ncbi:MAG TPA: NAD-dependent epimerase/dehydratase family protein [Acidimicrobiales bacterium]